MLSALSKWLADRLEKYAKNQNKIAKFVKFSQ